MVEDTHDDLCWKIVSAIAEERGVEVNTIEEPVGDVVDIEALERLAGQAGESNSVELSASFRIAGCFITVISGGHVRASCPETNTAPQSSGCAD